MYIAQAKCPSNLNALSFLLSKIRVIQANKKVNTQTLSTYLLYIVFNINIYGGGRGFEPREPLSPCRFSRPIPSAGLGYSS